MNRVDGKVALVTGGGSGIGAASARLLAEAGARVVVTDVNEEGVAEVVADIESTDGRALGLTQDVTIEAEWERVMAATRSEFGRLDVLVNNAGISGAGKDNIETETLDEFRAVMNVNIDGVFLGCQKAIALMKETGGGSIVNVSSIYGLVGGGGPAYHSSKGAVRLLTKSVAVYCGNQGYQIRANSVHPGFIWTPMLAAALDRRLPDENMTEEGMKAMLAERHPIGRTGEAIEIARGILFLASDDSSFMTGAELVIDGGYTAV